MSYVNLSTPQFFTCCSVVGLYSSSSSSDKKCFTDESQEMHQACLHRWSQARVLSCGEGFEFNQKAVGCSYNIDTTISSRRMLPVLIDRGVIYLPHFVNYAPAIFDFFFCPVLSLLLHFFLVSNFLFCNITPWFWSLLLNSDEEIILKDSCILTFNIVLSKIRHWEAWIFQQSSTVHAEKGILWFTKSIQIFN